MTDHDPVLARALAAYTAPPAPAALSDRVLARLAGAPAGRAWSRRGVAVVAALAIAAAAALAVVAVGSGDGGVRATSDGHVVPGAARETVRLGGRAIAVAEPGADLRWTIAGRTARVEQPAGSVFYRVEPGGVFVVDTPAGTVEVTGTCFRVEVQPMSKLSRQHLIGAGLGAVIAATVVVVVYEGGVRVVNARGSVDLAAGERGGAITGGAPTRDDTGADSGAAPLDPAGVAALGPEAVARQAQAQASAARDQLAAATARIAVLEGQLAEVRAGPDHEPSAADPSADDLALWATRCEVHIDSPDVLGAAAATIDARRAADWGLTATEVPVLEHALADMHGAALAAFRDIYIAATGNTALADELTAGAMFSEIYDKSVPADRLRARDRMARERAGLAAPPTDLAALPPVERALRLIYQLGNDFEHALGDALGGPRAKELRRRHNAWPGMRLDDEGCDESP